MARKRTPANQTVLRDLALATERADRAEATAAQARAEVLKAREMVEYWRRVGLAANEACAGLRAEKATLSEFLVAASADSARLVKVLAQLAAAEKSIARMDPIIKAAREYGRLTDLSARTNSDRKLGDIAEKMDVACDAIVEAVRAYEVSP